MRSSLLFSFFLLLLISCSNEANKKVEEVDFSIDTDFNHKSADSKHILKQGKEEFRIETTQFDGGFKFQVKKKKRFLGKKQISIFAILSNQLELLEKTVKFHKDLKSKDLIGFESGFKTVEFNDTIAKVFYQEGIQKQLIESNRNREGIIFEESKSGLEVLFKPKRTKDTLVSNLKRRFASWQSNKLNTACFFDVVKTTQILKAWKEAQLEIAFTGVAYYLNPVSNLVEPILYHSNTIKEESKFLKEDFAALLQQDNTASCYNQDNFKVYFKKSENKFVLKKGVKSINKQVIIPSGLDIVMENQQIDLTEGAFILSFSPIKLFNFSVFSSDSSGRGIHVINARGKSKVANCSFNGLSSLSFQNWKLPSTVTFYESPVEISNSKFMNNSSEDGLNLFRSFPFVVDSCTFQNTFSDAFDADFSDGVIKNTTFNNLGNDGIDVSGSNVAIKNCQFTNVADKALSAGEESTMNVMNILVDGAELAITAKDNSSIKITNSEIKNSEVVFCAFQKKKEFGSSLIEGANVSYSKFERDFLVEEKSTLILDGQSITNFEKDVKAILYGNEYGKATVK